MSAGRSACKSSIAEGSRDGAFLLLEDIFGGGGGGARPTSELGKEKSMCPSGLLTKTPKRYSYRLSSERLARCRQNRVKSQNPKGGVNLATKEGDFPGVSCGPSIGRSQAARTRSRGVWESLSASGEGEVASIFLLVTTKQVRRGTPRDVTLESEDRDLRGVSG